jgi:hypothetical protein
MSLLKGQLNRHAGRPLSSHGLAPVLSGAAATIINPCSLVGNDESIGRF